MAAVAAVMMIYLCSLRCARLAAVGDFLVLSGTKIYISELHIYILKDFEYE